MDNIVPHEYGPSTVGHGESQCKWCKGTNRENAVIAPNHCDVRALKDPEFQNKEEIIEYENYEDYLHRIGWLEHKPKEGYPRPGHDGEFVYNEEWAKLMRRMPVYGNQAPNGMLADILHQLRSRITQRHATVCASVVCWLGTNCGQSIILEARQHINLHHMHGPKAYLAAWAGENVRHSWLNHGFKTIEHILAPPDHFGKEFFGIGGIALLRRPELTVEDYETVECLMQWFGSDKGQMFIANCESEIQGRQRLSRKAKQIGATL